MSTADRTRLAVPVVSDDPPVAEQVAAARAAGADVVELRVDCIGDVAAVEALLCGPRALPVIVTVRAREEGGQWTGTEAERLALLARLARLRPDYVDLECAAWERSPEQARQIVAGGAPVGATACKVIVSHHDLVGTPADLEPILDRLARVPADVYKAIFTARDATDTVRVLAALARRGDRERWVILAMGPAGVATRILARKFGAFLTFASLQAGAESAPGQLTLAELRDRYRWFSIGPRTRVFGVVGWPVAHSLSPLVHNAAMAADGIDGVYVPWPVAPSYEDFAAFMDGLRAWEHGNLGTGAPPAPGPPGSHVIGLSVTLPHKEHALRWLVERGQAVTDLARRCGAVNALTGAPDGTWAGDNTDAGGALAAVEALRPITPGTRVDVLGAGGVARAVVAALIERGCEVTVYNRTPARAERLARDLRCSGRPWAARLAGAGEVIINCTSVGLAPAVDETPLPAEGLRPGTVVMDTVYTPARTRLLSEAAARGCRVVSGIEMFIGQAAAQYARWHGVAPPAEKLGQILRAAGAEFPERGR